MSKENLQLISARIDQDTLAKIERFMVHHPYWKRNAVINNILTTVLNDFDGKMIYDMVRRSFFRDSTITAHYEIERDGQYLGYEKKPQ